MTPDEQIVERQLLQTDFVCAFGHMQDDAFAINQAHGFNDPDGLIDEFQKFLFTKVPSEVYDKYKPLIEQFTQARTGLRLMLIVTELSEALEGVRKTEMHDSHIPEFTAEEAELADAVIRIMNLATSDKCRLAEAIVAKQNYNRNRPFKHGGKKF